MFYVTRYIFFYSHSRLEELRGDTVVPVIMHSTFSFCVVCGVIVIDCHRFSDSFGQFRIVLDSFRQFQIVLDSFRQFQIVSDSFGQFRIVSGSFGQFRIVSDSFGQFQIVLNSFGQFRIVSDSFRQFRIVWIVSGLGQFRIVSDSFRQFRIVQDRLLNSFYGSGYVKQGVVNDLSSCWRVNLVLGKGSKQTFEQC